ncbi:TIGR04211 family SH3 domain-containing protein [Nitrosococcus wardiae]|uniref:TIGR04211 family SH3 domain-containing protein n=1 Tax=Nitrosococcus wardiae TaxID=1814290 RepID=UPI001F0E1534|nr:TIGR04211 family SH3 domain-containing protein [Nitrosococcus wardiae]
MLFVISCLALTPTPAQTIRYITDQIEVTLRTGQGIEHRVLQTLESGVAVKVLETRSEGYSRIQTEEGVEGWVLSRYLVSTPSAKEQLSIAKQRIANLELKTAQLKEEIQKISQQRKTTQEKSQTLLEDNQRLGKELEYIRQTAASALAIDSENKRLKDQLINLERVVQGLQQENVALRDRTAREWFLLGAGVILIGMLIGLVIPKIRWKRRSTWSDSL